MQDTILLLRQSVKKSLLFDIVVSYLIVPITIMLSVCNVVH